MQNLSMQEFKKMFELSPSSEFIFSSENQSWNIKESALSAKLTFTAMVVVFNPNTIYFKNSTDCICFNRVKRVDVSDNKSILGTVFTIVCGDHDNNFNDTKYTMIAR